MKKLIFALSLSLFCSLPTYPALAQLNLSAPETWQKSESFYDVTFLSSSGMFVKIPKSKFALGGAWAVNLKTGAAFFFEAMSTDASPIGGFNYQVQHSA